MLVSYASLRPNSARGFLQFKLLLLVVYLLELIAPSFRGYCVELRAEEVLIFAFSSPWLNTLLVMADGWLCM